MSGMTVLMAKHAELSLGIIYNNNNNNNNNNKWLIA
jgi:hypothetical protein